MNFIKNNWLFVFVMIGLLVYFVGRKIYFQPKYVNGEVAPVFEATTWEEAPFDLAQFKGKSYVLIDFWGSWCGPCRAESGALVAFYQAYKDKPYSNAESLEVVSVGIEQNEKSWRNAIRQDGLNWPYHILDETTSMRFLDGHISSLYGVKEVPSKFLVSPEGYIIAVNQNFEQMGKLLDKQLRNGEK